MVQPLQTMSIVAPAKFGLNTEQSNALLGPDWAVEALNCVFDGSGRLAARKGWTAQNGTILESGADIKTLHHAITAAGSQYISTLNNKIYLGLSSPSDITGSITTPTDDNWQLQNFNNKVVGWQVGHNPIVWTGGGSFADISFTYPSAGTSTWGNVCLAAFGRIFTTDSSNTVIKYSDLLVENSFTDDSGSNGDGGGSAGIIDLKSVWVYGRDEVTALVAHNGQLVIFGKHSITIYSSGSSASPTDFDPANAQLVDVIYGVGCVARDSVATIGNDVWFLSDSGIRSLGRTVLQEKMPLQDISRNVKTYLRSFTDTADLDAVKAIYNEKEGLYLLSIPSSNIVFVFDIRQPLQDGSHRATVWANITPTSYMNDESGDLFLGQAGYIGQYEGYQDNGTGYTLTYRSGWSSLDPQASRYNIIKRMAATFYSGATNNLTLDWNFDWGTEGSTFTKQIVGPTPDEWGIAEYGIAEYSGGGSFNQIRIPVLGTGSAWRFGFTATVNASVLAFQKLTVHAKLGRLAG